MPLSSKIAENITMASRISKVFVFRATIITTSKSLTDMFSINQSKSHDLYNAPNPQKRSVSPSELLTGKCKGNPIQYIKYVL